MPEPGLSEIVNMTVDPERGSGNPAVIYDSKPLIAQLNQSAQFKAENDWKKYNLFLGNLKDVYKDMNEIAKMPVMTKDREALKEQMAGIVKGIASDPHGFFGGGAKYQETLANISKLQSDATESKQNNLYDEAHRNYFYRNPELDTQENRSLVDGYVNQKLGSRQPYLMKLPGLFDAKAMGDEISAIIKEKGSDENPTEDNQFLKKRTWEKYDPNKFRTTAEQFLYQADKRGIPVYETMAKRYEKLPEAVKQKYAGSADPVKDFYLDTLSAYRPQDSETIDLVANPGYLEKEKLAENKRQANLDNARGWAQINLAKDNQESAGTEDIFSADSVLGEVRDVLKNATKKTRINSDGSRVQMLEVSDPSLLREFGTIDKDGNVTNVPDVVDYDESKNQLSLVYYKKKSNGEVKTGDGGKKEIDRTIPVNPTQWMGQIVRRKNPNKEIGAINVIVEQVFNKHGRSLRQLADNYKSVGSTGGGSSNTPVTDPNLLRLLNN